MARIPIIFVTSQFGQGENGPETYARYLYEHFRRSGQFDFHVVAPGLDSPREGLHGVPKGLGSYRLYEALSLKAIEVQRLHHSTPGVVHTNCSHFDPILLQSRWPIVGQINDYEVCEVFRRLLFTIKHYGLQRTAALLGRYRREQQFVRHQAVTVCNSEYTRKVVVRTYRPRSPDTILRIYKSVDIDAFRPRRRESLDKQTPGGRLRVVFVGSDHFRKGLGSLLSAVELNRTPIELRVVGPDLTTLLRTYKAHRKVLQSNQVVVYGRLSKEELKTLLWSSDVFALPTVAEALGVAVLEAAAADLRVVTTSVGGLAEIIPHIEGVHVVEPNNPSQLAAALVKASAASSCAIRPSFRGTFGHLTMLNHIEALYSELCRKSSIA